MKRLPHIAWLMLSACQGAAPPPKPVPAPANPPVQASQQAKPEPAPPGQNPPASVKVLAVDIQYGHACALTERRSLRCWGNNKFGQLGYGDTRPRLASEAADVPLPGPVESFAVGSNTTCAVVGGAPWCWGTRTSRTKTQQIGDDEPIVPAARVDFPKPVTAIVQGRNYACLLDRDGDVTCWGSNTRNELGACSKPRCGGDTTLPSGMNAVKLGFPAVALTAGEEHTCALSRTGGVRCWGFAENGLLGYVDDAEPQEVGDLPLPGKAIQISAANNGTTALLDDGRLLAWNDHTARERRPLPELFMDPPNQSKKRAARVSRGYMASCGVFEGGAVECWANEFMNPSVLGYGVPEDPTFRRQPGRKPDGSERPAWQIDLPAPARDVAVSKFKLSGQSRDFMCAVLVDGRLYCWGNGSEDKVLGYDRTDDIGDNETPVQVGPVPLAP